MGLKDTLNQCLSFISSNLQNYVYPSNREFNNNLQVPVDINSFVHDSLYTCLDNAPIHDKITDV